MAKRISRLAATVRLWRRAALVHETVHETGEQVESLVQFERVGIAAMFLGGKPKQPRWL